MLLTCSSFVTHLSVGDTFLLQLGQLLLCAVAIPFLSCWFGTILSKKMKKKTNTPKHLLYQGDTKTHNFVEQLLISCLDLNLVLLDAFIFLQGDSQHHQE
jgi:hypothetical protein